MNIEMNRQYKNIYQKLERLEGTQTPPQEQHKHPLPQQHKQPPPEQHKQPPPEQHKQPLPNNTNTTHPNSTKTSRHEKHKSSHLRIINETDVTFSSEELNLLNKIIIIIFIKNYLLYEGQHGFRPR